MDSHDEMTVRIKAIEESLNEIKETLTDIRRYCVESATDITAAKTTIDKVAVEVMPTINGLLESPMLKMLMPKGKK